MVTGSNVLEMLIPQGGWTISGDSYDGIQFLECEPISEEAFNAGFAQYPAWKAEQDESVAAARLAAETKLEALGLTPEDLAALGL